jgi:hypothetical protein
MGLLELFAATADAREQLPVFYASKTAFDPKVVIDRRGN